ncbi:MF6LB protein, partial [Steatornis caripensis]|nr:MF6LB protein [Steatornis caripensis]
AMGEQWDPGLALALCGLFRVLQGAGRACTAPFLTLYLRQLGLQAPLVGIVAGAKYLVSVLWAPLCCCCLKAGRARCLLVTGCLLGSAVASLLLTFIPLADQHAVYKYCNARHPPGDRGAAAMVPAPGTSSYGVLSTSAIMNAKAVSEETMKTAADVLTESGKPTLTKMLASYRPPLHGLENETSSLASAATDLAANAEESLCATEKNELSLFKTTLPTVGDAYVSGDLSDQQKAAQDVIFEAVQNIFQDRERQVFLMVLGVVVFWELLATSFEQIVDESLYEYLFFMDTADKYGRLWIWSYLGASVGACSIAVFVDQLNCFLSSTVTYLTLHFYIYALLIMLSSLVSVFFPIYVPKKKDRVNKTTKALALLWSDGQAILYTVTIALTGVAGSAVQNFLFWQIKDRGSNDVYTDMYLGLSVAVGQLAEIMLYFFKRKLLRTFSGGKIVAVSLSLLAVQLLCYSFLWTTWSVLLVQILSAFSSGALWWVVNRMVDDIATLGMERSLQAVLQGLCYSGGASLGSFVGGFVVKYFGLAFLFRACCVCLVLWLFLFIIVQSKLPQQKKKKYSCLLTAISSDLSDSDDENEMNWLAHVRKDESSN